MTNLVRRYNQKNIIPFRQTLKNRAAINGGLSGAQNTSARQRAVRLPSIITFADAPHLQAQFDKIMREVRWQRHAEKEALL